MKSTLLILLAAVLLSSCVTKKGARNYFLNNKGEAADFCSTMFPPVETYGRVDTILIEGDNKDYSSTIDSLNDQLSYARGILEMYAKSAPDTCKYLVAIYEKEINSMSERIKALQAKYKPCAPTIREITKTITVVDAALKDVNARLEERLRESEDKSSNRLKWIIGMGAVLLVSGYFNLKKILPI